MFLSQLEDEKRESVIRDFKAVDLPGISPFVMNDEIQSEHLIVLYSSETDCFWTLGMSLFQKNKLEEALKTDEIGVYWKLIRETYKSEQKKLVYRKIGARAYVFGLEEFRKKHPYTASKLILWDSEQMDHLLMKYERDVIEASFAIQSLKYPQIEKLYKAGFEHIILNWVLRDTYTAKQMAMFEECFKDKRTVNQITSLTKGQWSQLITFKLDLDEWLWMKRILNAYKIADVNVPALTKMMIRGGDRFRKSFEKVASCTIEGNPAYEADQLVRDLLNDHGHTDLPAEQACIYLWDYIHMCQRNHVEPDYRTTALRDEHDTMQIMQRERRESRTDENTEKVYRERFNQLCDYLYETDDLVVLLPEKWSDLIYEGRHNHNCVGSLYVSRYEKGTSNIFFIREKKDPSQSYITVELTKNCESTIQAFYSYNRKITKKRDLRFIEQWLEENRKYNRMRKGY